MAPSAHFCPTCRKPTSPRTSLFQFCSERCRTQDLANWATGEYAIPVVPTEADEQWDIPGDTDGSERAKNE